MNADQSLILAAGGILVCHESDGEKLAVVVRARYPGEIALPKGKINEGETILDAARRETLEETGFEGKNPEFAGTINYFDGETPKVVFFFKMDVVRKDSAKPRDPEEIADLKWMSPIEAAQKLTHEENQRLIIRVFGLPSSIRKKRNPWKRLRISWSFLASPEYDRLADAISGTRIELESNLSRSDLDIKAAPCTRTIYHYIFAAEKSLKDGKLHSGWVNIQLAQRTILEHSDLAKAHRVALVLKRELERITGWRSKAISDLICDEQGKLITIDSSERVSCLADAISLRDDYFNTSHFKIFLRRRHLFVLSMILLGCVLGSLFLWPDDFLPEKLHGIRGRLLITVVGALGAGMSVAQNLLNADIAATIPAQRIGAFVVWMRPAIGAAAALIAVSLVATGHKLGFFTGLMDNTAAITVIAFAAGFSERFITQAIDNVSKTTDKQ